MGGQESKSAVSTLSKSVVTATKTTPFGVTSPRQRIVQKFLLIWVDTNIDQSNENCQNALTQLRNIVNDVHVFVEQDEAIGFLNKSENTKVFLLVNGTIGQLIVPLIHDVPQLDTICIFCEDPSIHEHWVTKWNKIKGVHAQIKSICEELHFTIKQYNQSSIAVSFIQNLNQLEPTFMYTQIFKEILLEMEHDAKSIHDFIQFWRRHYTNNTFTLNIISRLERDYSPQSSIQWYTREYFIYQMLNQALRLLEGDTIINMGFFIRDLHQQIEQLHQKQVNNYGGKPFTVYRGQGLLNADFEQLLKSKGGLMSFNNFLSTSKVRDMSLAYATSASTGTDIIGILFKITIDPAVSSAPFAYIEEVSYSQTEEEILFSMNTIFRVDEITELENNNSLYQVELRLTADDDEDLRILIKRIREEVIGTTARERSGTLLLKLNQYNKATELYNSLLKHTSDEGERAHYYNQLGYIKQYQGDYEKAIEYYEKAIEICEESLPANHSDLTTTYDNIGGVYMNMGEYTKALLFYEKSLAIREKTLPVNHLLLTTSYNSIAGVYYNIGENSKALSFFENTRQIFEKTLPVNHPDLATFYNNIGGVCTNMGNYSKALLLYRRSLDIQENSAATNQSLLATSYNNIGMVCANEGEYSKALSFYEKSLEIREKILRANHPDLAGSYNNIGSVYMNMGEYSKALSFYEKALKIWKETLPASHPLLATSYNNIGSVYRNAKTYSRALFFFERSLEIREKILPANHPDLASSYNNIGCVYMNVGEYSKALSFYQRALNILQSSLPSNHPHTQSVRRSIEILKNVNQSF